LLQGASKGIGAVIAKTLALAGGKLVINYAHSEADADHLVLDIRNRRGNAIAIKADVSSGY